MLTLSLLTEFSLKMLDNRYFEMVKEFVEEFFANKRPSLSDLTHIVGLIKRIAQCPKTEYSQKFLELV